MCNCKNQSASSSFAAFVNKAQGKVLVCDWATNNPVLWSPPTPTDAAISKIATAATCGIGRENHGGLFSVWEPPIPYSRVSLHSTEESMWTFTSKITITYPCGLGLHDLI